MKLKHFLSAKVQGVKVTGKNLYYLGSVTIDKAILEAAHIEPFEKVQVVNLATGARLETYVIEGEEGSGAFELNGGAARSGEIGDSCLIISYLVGEKTKPIVVFLDQDNHVDKVVSYDKVLSLGSLKAEDI